MRREVSRYKKNGKKQADNVQERAIKYDSELQINQTLFKYSNLEINNFRCFDKLQIGPLEQVNLITGVNNVGKTTLLEAIFLLIGLSNPDLASRIDRWRGLVIPNELSEATWRTLFWQFNDRTAVRLVAKDIKDNKRTLTISVTSSTPSFLEQKVLQTGSESLGIVGQDIIFDYIDEAKRQHKVRGTPILIRRGDILTFQLKLEPPPLPIAIPGIFLTSRYQGTIEEEVQRFSNLRLKHQDEFLILALKNIEPRLERLEILSRQGVSMIHGHLKGHREPIPAPLLGDGVRRVMSILLAIGVAQGNVVLIDEIENGVHHSVMKQLWEVIPEAARLFNTQIFATTHSHECIVAAHETFSEKGEYNFRLHRLDRLNGTIRATTYDQESLEGALSIPLEVRGWQQE